MTLATLIVGIGSFHGDDQIGWKITQELRPLLPAQFHVRQLATADELLTCCDGLQRLVIVDACQGSGEAGTCRRWTWPALPRDSISSLGTHGYDLGTVLEMASELRLLPEQVAIWTIEIKDAQVGQPLSVQLETLLPSIVRRILDEEPWLAPAP